MSDIVEEARALVRGVNLDEWPSEDALDWEIQGDENTAFGLAAPRLVAGLLDEVASLQSSNRDYIRQLGGMFASLETMERERDEARAALVDPVSVIEPGETVRVRDR